MQNSEIRLGFIGFGHMAQVIFEAIAKVQWLPLSQVRFTRRNEEKRKICEKKFHILSQDLPSLCDWANVLLFCVRPREVQAVFDSAPQKNFEKKIVFSVLAGVPIAYFLQTLATDQIVRVMPNTPSAVLEGMTLLSFHELAAQSTQRMAKELFGCMGKVMEIAEQQMDIGCAIAGSGPGFVFRLIEAMAKAGQARGLTYEQALPMAAQTFVGASKLILEGNMSPAKLIQQIATPGGTTEAGFRVMDQLQVEEALGKVLFASADQSASLSQLFHR